MIEIRWLKRKTGRKIRVPDNSTLAYRFKLVDEVERVLQVRAMLNIEEIGIQDPIWSEWQDVPEVEDEH